MESLQDRSPSSEGPSPSKGRKGGKLDRIAGHTRGLVEDLREWIDLRIDLAILELEERVDELRNEVALGITLAFFGFFAAMFVLTTVALGLGWLLGHPFWGFLIVSSLLVLIVLALSQARPDLVPSSNLFETLRGASSDPSAENDDRPVRDMEAEVEDSAQSGPSTSSS